MNPILYNSFEEIDAAFFSGDTFHSEEDREQAKEYIERWQRELKVLEDAAEEEKINS